MPVHAERFDLIASFYINCNRPMGAHFWLHNWANIAAARQ